MTVKVHHTASAEALVSALAAELAAPLSDPFATDVVTVPGPGVARWLSQRLSHVLGAEDGADGVCAGVAMPTWDRWARDLTRELAGIERDSDPWRPGRGVWQLLECATACAHEPWWGQVAPVWAGPHRWAHAQTTFARFLRLADDRPELVTRWVAGELVGPDDRPLGADQVWQAELYRRLVERLDVPDPVVRLELALARLDSGDAPVPQRLHLFAPGPLRAGQRRLLTALGDHRPVHAWQPTGSPKVWTALSALPPLTDRQTADAACAAVIANRLTRRLGRESRECALLWRGHATGAALESAAPAEGLLGRLQASIIADEPLRPAPLAADDRSIAFHASHGPDRQVEVLREVVCGLLADDPSLEPRDIVVLSPALATHAPLLAAVFDPDPEAPGDHPARRVRVRIADTDLRQINPLLATLARLMDLAQSRAAATQLLDLCADPPVARRFGFDDNDLESLTTLITEAGLRWGLDAAHRAPWSLQSFGQNTWRSALDRLLLGVALDESHLEPICGVLPHDRVESTDVDLVGRLAELMARLSDIVDAFAVARPMAEWVAECRAALASVTEVSGRDSWQLAHAWSELAELGAGSASDLTVELTDVRAALEDALTGRSSRADFRSGALTVCSMTALRHVPHRVVILLGLDETVFPRRVSIDGDDLLAGHAHIGEPDPRAADRQALLDAVMSAQQQLVVIHQAFSATSGRPRPAAVPLVELREALTELCDRDPWPQLERRHPLHPHTDADFTGAIPFSFDPTALAQAQTAAGPQNPPEPRFALVDPLPPLEALTQSPIPIDLDDVVAFFNHPAKALLRRRAQLYVAADDEPISDEIPLALDGMSAWRVGDRILQAHLRGAPMWALRDAELARGEIPPGAYGRAQLDDIGRQVNAIAFRITDDLAIPATTSWVNADVGPFRLTGSVSGIRDTTILNASYSWESGRDRFAAWLRLLALTASRPQVSWRAKTVGRRGRGHVLGPVPVTDARGELKRLLDLYAKGLSQLLPLPPKTAAEIAAEAEQPGGPSGARKTWRFEHDAAWGLFVGPRLEDLTRARFGGQKFEQLAVTVWRPLLLSEGPLR